METPEGLEYHLRARDLWEQCTKDMKKIRALGGVEWLPAVAEIRLMTTSMLECTQGIFEVKRIKIK